MQNSRTFTVSGLTYVVVTEKDRRLPEKLDTLKIPQSTISESRSSAA